MTKKFLKLFTIYGHLGHATLGIYTNFRSQFRRRRLKFGFDWQSGFGDDLWKGGRMDGHGLDGCTISSL